MVFELKIILSCWAVDRYSRLALQDAFQPALRVKLALLLEFLRWRAQGALRGLAVILAGDVQWYWLHRAHKIIDVVHVVACGLLHLLVCLAGPVGDWIINATNLQLLFRCCLVNSRRISQRWALVPDWSPFGRSTPFSHVLRDSALRYQILQLYRNGVLLPFFMFLLLFVMLGHLLILASLHLGLILHERE